ncbi:hypothetical protein HGI47_09925 [Novosphingobium sp. ERN07]|uniref:hypothetical protein n=1 Tax=Novosphingobium sp. ERN07 TaxID=2726187 RepID=UPI0014563D78|nr:hypothetical protein [Novosphingobium sp. ERN07]NLR71190.1 hypothetical protein [Novosphingobium sp. ERN07]
MQPYEVAELLTLPPVGSDWFRNAEQTSTGRKLVTRSNTSNTLGDMELRVECRGNRQHELSAWLKNANATRTLAHLLAQHGDAENFLDRIRNLSPFDFFGQSSRPIPRSFGSGGDNWLHDPDLVRAHLGPDPFGAFLPVYVAQLQLCVASILAPPSAEIFVCEGTDIVVVDDEVSCRWAWGDVRVPQIEIYFERHHSRAVGAVRAAASAALASLDNALARRYETMESDFVERVGDSLTIGTVLNDRYRLKTYAKARSRLRFEVIRTGKGDYARLSRPVHPQDRLLSIMEMERENLLTAARWGVVGTFFEEHPDPQTDDVARLFARIAEACSRHGVLLEPIMARLLEDGGCLESDETLPDALMSDLCRTGILRRYVVRRQDHRLPDKRYALTPAYRHLATVIRTTLAGIS